MTNDQLRQQAVQRAKEDLERGDDWQEVQCTLLNTDKFQPLFPSTLGMGPVSAEDGALTMRIIREAEEVLGFA
ncbi:hypothetical protein [Sphingosinicella sp. BN140058]|uniref:hypothetical protein n=1 Tax=Sphingosinicella sp. BN140058 TaxID=1892855 RepID=UPI0010120793|nr:hypothetical protein [Sphingosinicella sp. BN140058]QAY80256.1 hypothetical protein ETR14_26800 [Sphingosinicella sp. BN140058]